jgi:hypothetical protein
VKYPFFIDNPPTYKKLYKKPFYIITIIIIYGSYLLFLLGIYYVNPSYITNVFKYFEIFLCLFFIIRFHPFRKAVLRDFDQTLIFMSGFIILTNVVIIEYIVNIVNKNKTVSDIVNVLHRGTTPIIGDSQTIRSIPQNSM